MLATFITDVVMSRSFETIGAAVVSLIFGVIVRIISHNRRHKTRMLNDLSVGLEMIVTSIILIVTMSTGHFISVNRLGAAESIRHDLNSDFAVSHWEVLWFVAVLIVTSLLISFLGWKNKHDLHGFWGVFVPNVIGVLSLWYVFDKY